MADDVVADSTEYPVDADSTNPIKLTVRITDEHAGSTDVTQAGELLKSGKILDWEIGTAKDLKEKRIMCTTTVKRVNTATKHSGVIYQLRGGLSDEDFPYAREIDEMGDRVVYKVGFFFA